MIYKGTNNEYLQLQNINCNDCSVEKNENLDNPLTLIWFEKENNIIEVDQKKYTINANQIVCLTEFHTLDYSTISHAKIIRFNRAFYCIIDHDKEIGCKGILFFGASQLPILNIPEEELEVFTAVWKMFEFEMNSSDSLQLEMLQTMLKRFVILCTRVYKTQENYTEMDDFQIDILREYNFLIEQHFKTIHSVSEYAEMLHKSPKTLSNLFSKIAKKSPLQYIQDRRSLEAKRLLTHSDKSIKEIGFELGFEDIQSFSRFFKKQEGVSPSEFKEK